MTATTSTPPPRFVALDAFRGATIFLMILVNTAGPGAHAYAQLSHAKWIGFTVADLIFPTFLFAMGNAMSFAQRKPLPTNIYLRRLVRRSAIIFALGFLMYWFPFVTHDAGEWSVKPLADTRIPGVLQRLALCYLVAGILVRWVKPRWILVAGAAMLLAYWLILLGFSAPGQAFAKSGNAGTRLDLWLLGQRHLYVKDGGFDPEGLLGTLPATVNVLAGYLAGRLLLRADDLRRSVRTMIVWGLGLVIAGLAWAPWFPIAKKLWTGSFVLITNGLDLIILAAAVALIEIARAQRGVRFFTIMGRNPLAIYLFSELFVAFLALFPVAGYRSAYEWLGIAVFQQIAPGPAGSLLCAFAYTMLCWAVGWFMDRRGIILKA